MNPLLWTAIAIAAIVLVCLVVDRRRSGGGSTSAADMQRAQSGTHADAYTNDIRRNTGTP